jgi:quaternary ammonium compound-resistance protein SugE
MVWFLLLVAGLFEVGFTTCLKLSEGFSRVGPSVGFFVFAVLSFVLLTMAVERVPLGTAYAVWTGIGASGTALVGIFFFGDPVNVTRVLFLVLIVGSIVGLKVASP